MDERHFWSSGANVPFAYWACNGITRGANEALEIGSDVTLDAVYSAATVVTLPDATPANFTVTFDGNGVQDPSPKTTNRTFSGWNQSGTGGIAPANTYYTPTSDVTLNAIWTEAVIDLPTVSRWGYTFGGWTSTTGANVLATATSYKPTSNETLTAVWTANNYTIKYDANGGEGTMLPQTIAYDAEVTLSPSTYTKADYTFKRWATTPNGQIVYKDGEAVKNLSNENGAEITLYAVYIANEYVVSFSAGEENSVAGKSTNTIADKVIKMDEEFTLPTPERKFNVIYGLNGGYMLGGAQTTAIASAVFKGWTITKPSLTTDDEEKQVQPVVDFMPNASVSNITSEGVLTLYPVWDMESATVTLPNTDRAGYIFTGWEVNGDDNKLSAGEVVVIDSDTTIEATWKVENPTPTPTPNNEEINNQINQIIETLNGIKKVSDLTSSQVTQLTSLLTSVYNFDSETATDIINAIKNSTLTEEEKLELLKAISSGSISEEMRKKLVEMIQKSTTLNLIVLLIDESPFSLLLYICRIIVDLLLEKKKSNIKKEQVKNMGKSLPDQMFCRAANQELKEKDLRCDSCPLYGGERICSYTENGEEFPDFIGAGSFEAEYALLQRGLQFAARAHKGTYRKGSHVPYILHPMEAVMIVRTMTDDCEVLTAAALHDVIEDTEYTYEAIRQEFGERVACLVAYESENKRPEMTPESSWLIRKQEGIAHIRKAPLEAKQIALGDKLSNMRATKRDYEQLGEAFWELFHQKNKRAHAWYYYGLLDAMKELKDAEAYREYKEIVTQVFGRSPRILVDADACPVVRIVEQVAQENFLPVTLLCDTNHVLHTDYSDVKVIGAGVDAVDFALVTLCHRGDFVVTQDYGVAAMALGKGARVIHQSGRRYTNENIDQLLMERHLAKKARKSSKNHMKGPAKRTREDDRHFEEAFRRLLAEI